MKYLSAKEIASIWKVNVRTVQRYASEGRIKDAYLIGKTWMIPENAKKEECIKNNNNVVINDSTNNEFHFPLYIYRDFYNLKNTLKTKDEIKLYEGFELYLNCEFNKAYTNFLEINDSTSDVYLKITSLYAMIMCCLNLHKYSKMMSYIFELNEIFMDEFDYKEEMKLLLIALESDYKGLNSLIDTFVKPGYKYSKEVVPMIATLSLYSEAVENLNNNKNVNTNMYELILLELEETNCIFPSIMLHTELGVIYYSEHKFENACYHIKEAYNLALKYNGLYYLAYISEPVSKIIKTCLQKLDIEINSNLKKYYTQINKSFVGLMSYLNKPNTIFSIGVNDYEYIVFANKEMTNKEIAYNKGISESAVAQRYAKLYDIFDVHNKNELVKEFKNKLNKY